jgi:peptidyl-tRNA hydrolase
MIDREPCLYIFARNDLASLNPGKLAAQATHAANMAQTACERSSDLKKLWREWAGDRGFGTAIVLACPPILLEVLSTIEQYGKTATGVVLDPTYPVRDGQVTHLLPLTTCGYVFGRRSDPYVQILTAGLELYP